MIDKKATFTIIMSTMRIPRHCRATTVRTLRYACLAVMVLTLELYDGRAEVLSVVAESSKRDLMYTLMQYPNVVNCKMVDTAAKANKGPQ